MVKGHVPAGVQVGAVKAIVPLEPEPGFETFAFRHAGGERTDKVIDAVSPDGRVTLAVTETVVVPSPGSVADEAERVSEMGVCVTETGVEGVDGPPPHEISVINPQRTAEILYNKSSHRRWQFILLL